MRHRVALALATLLLAACGDDPVAMPRSLAVSPDSLPIPFGGTGTVGATVTGLPGQVRVDWQSRTPAVATVDPTGTSVRVAAAGVGRAWLVASVAGERGLADSVEVIVAAPPCVGPGIVVTPPSFFLAPGGTQQMRATPGCLGGGTNPTFRWRSTHPEVATIDAATGLVTAVAPGQSTIVVAVESLPAEQAAVTVTVIGQ